MKTCAIVGALAALVAAAGGAGAQCPAPEVLLHTVTNPAGTVNGRFGHCVGISGNLAVVGWNQYLAINTDGPGAGVIFDTTTGATVATLADPAASTDDGYGVSCAISGNLAVVGGYLGDPGGIADTGIAYVFDTTGTLQATLLNPAPAVDDRFGVAVSISGNLALVGAYYDNPGGVNDAGTAYVFNATTGAWIQTLNNPEPDVRDWFGYSVALDGNLALVSAPLDDVGNMSDVGTVYVFDATSGALLQTLNNPGPVTGDWFGVRVGLSGNLAAVGAWWKDPGGVTDAGEAYVFDATTGALQSTLFNPSPGASDNFGWWVAISGNVAVVGAYFDDEAGKIDSGTATVFDAMTGAPLAYWGNPTTEGWDYYGSSVAIDGGTAIVGAFYDNPDGVNDAGAAYIYGCAPNAAGVWSLYE